jgi:plasmid stabilization system protein ParE
VSEIVDPIAEDRPLAARRWVRDLFAKAAAVRHHPRRGRKVSEVDRDQIREILFGEFRVIYRLDPKRIVVLTVRHGRRRWDPGEVEPEIE